MSHQPDFASLSVDQLEDEIGELAAHINAATCRWLLLVAEYDRREAWKAWGSRSCADWLSLRCGLAPGPGREHVRVARAVAELPLIRAEFAAGRLSYSKARALTRVATPESEGELVGLALHATAAQLDRIVRAFRGVISADLAHANRAHEMRYLTWGWEDDGSLSVRGRLPAEAGQAFINAVAMAQDELRADAGESHDVPAGTSEVVESPDERTAAQARADALALVAEHSLSATPAASSGGERQQVVVHADAPVLAGASCEGRCELERGPAIPPETARRLACDAAVVRVTEGDGRPLSVGRRTRSIPPAIRRALRSRDAGCRFPGCSCHRHVDAHHIEHWAQGGETKLSNLVLLCRRHHRLLHEGGFSMHAEPGGALVFTRPDGRRIKPATPPPRRGDRLAVTCGAPHAGKPITSATPVALSGGGRYDLGMAVDLVLQATGRADGVSPGSPAPPDVPAGTS